MPYGCKVVSQECGISDEWQVRWNQDRSLRIKITTWVIRLFGMGNSLEVYQSSCQCHEKCSISSLFGDTFHEISKDIDEIILIVITHCLPQFWPGEISFLQFTQNSFIIGRWDFCSRPLDNCCFCAWIYSLFLLDIIQRSTRFRG